MSIPDELIKAAGAAKKQGSVAITPRGLLAYYGFARRGANKVGRIRKDLKKLGVRTEPDFDTVWVDLSIQLVPTKADATGAGKGETAEASAKPDALPAKAAATEVAPSHRISRLKAANTKPISVKPTDRLDTAVTLMMQHDFSQLPVLANERDCKGLVSWRSIGNRLVMSKNCDTVKDCMEDCPILRSDESMFEVVRHLTRHECVLVRSRTNVISGIVTAADISEQFRTLSEPFLLLGDIENSLRSLIERSFKPDEIAGAKDPSDVERKIESASDLSFGEYARLLENPTNWTKLSLALDRVLFNELLHEVRRIRNDVMHFDPDGISEEQLATLQRFARMLEKIGKLSA